MPETFINQEETEMLMTLFHNAVDRSRLDSFHVISNSSNNSTCVLPYNRHRLAVIQPYNYTPLFNIIQLYNYTILQLYNNFQCFPFVLYII